MKKTLIFSMLVVGLSGIVAQVILLRELLIIFYGNELTMGIILANWLVLEAVGVYLLGKKAENSLRKLEIFVGIQIFFSITFPLSIYLTRIIRNIFGIVPGEGLGLGFVFLFSLLILSPVSISHGALFTFGSKLFSLYSQLNVGGIGKVYVYETLGTILGGFFFTYLLLPYFNSFQLAFSITIINLFFCIILLGKFWKKEKLNKILGIVSFLLLLINLSLFWEKKIEEIHFSSLKKQWKGYRVKHYENSYFGNIVVAEKERSLYFFFNGIPVITLPYPDVFFIEEFAHFSLLSHPHPEEILIIGRGVGGIINEILKHPIKKIDYVEIDPIFLKIVKRFSDPLVERELNSPKLNIVYTDGRLFLKKTDKKYDLIVLGFSNPSDLQTNRYFSEEFFSLIKKRLKEGGILVFSLPSLPRAILNLKEIRNLNACILNTLKNVFKYIRIIPGEGNNLFLSSESIIEVNKQIFLKRMTERKIESSLLIPYYIEYRLQPFWYENFSESLKHATLEINRDFKPLATFYSLSYWGSLFSPHLLKFINKIVPLLPLFIFILFISVFFSRNIHLSLPLSIATSGFAGIIFDLIFIFIFQVSYGYVFHWVGILVTSFMSGIALGGFMTTLNLEKIKKEKSAFLAMELLIFLFALILQLIYSNLENPLIFIIFSLIAGTLIGLEFPLASKIYFKSSSNLSKTAGILYAADLLGGWWGGILGGVFLIPFLGIGKTCFLIALLKLINFLTLFFTKEK